MGTIKITSLHKPAQAVHMLAGGKHSFAHALACAALANHGKIYYVPDIIDSRALIQALTLIFKEVIFDKSTHTLLFSKPKYHEEIIITKQLLDNSRNIYCLLPALLYHSASVKLEGDPAGCHIGQRPTDWYLSTLQEFGVQVLKESNTSNLIMTWPTKKSAIINFQYPSMTGTVIAIAAAAISPGISQIHGFSVEPSCDDQLHCYQSTGGNVYKKNDILYIEGLNNLSSVDFKVTADRVHAVTMITAALLSRGSVELKSHSAIRIPKFIDFLHKAGVEVYDHTSSIAVVYPKNKDYLNNVDITAGSEPLFSSDWVPFAALLMATRSTGISRISDDVFLKRFQFIDYLPHQCIKNMKIQIDHSGEREKVIAEIHGIPDATLLGGISKLCPDIRGSAAILLSAIISSSPVIIQDDFQIRRGYEDLSADIENLGVATIIKE